MTMDLTVTEYRTYDDLYEYVYGSAAVIGLQMVPILEPTSPEAHDRATAWLARAAGQPPTEPTPGP
jgi:phytoene synthase